MKKLLTLTLILTHTLYSIDLAIDGYDCVAFFTEKKAIKGVNTYSFEYDKKKWLFSSLENKKKFIEAPQNYTPQYNGNCAWAVGNGYTFDGSPLSWTIHNNKLYFNYSNSVMRKWRKNKSALIESGDKNWESLGSP